MASKTTTDHVTIQRWAEERGGKPATVRDTARGDEVGILRIDFPGYSGEDRLQPISWDDFFRKFDESGLALLYEDGSRDGDRSRFNKLIGRDGAGSGDQRGRSGTRTSASERSRASGARSGTEQPSSNDALAVIEKDHRMVEQLMERFKSARGESQQWQLARRICTELTLHAEMEERSFYPQMRKVKALEPLVKEGLHEHQEVKRIISRIERMQAGDQRLSELMHELERDVQHHVNEEETELFPKVRQACDPPQLKELGKTLRHTKAEVKKESPGQPASERRVREDVREPEQSRSGR